MMISVRALMTMMVTIGPIKFTTWHMSEISTWHISERPDFVSRRFSSSHTPLLLPYYVMILIMIIMTHMRMIMIMIMTNIMMMSETWHMSKRPDF